MAFKKKSDDEGMSIIKLNQGVLNLCILGVSPLILNSMNNKTLTQLLLPPKRKNATEKSTTLKHNPYDEFRASAITSKDPDAPTLLQMSTLAFKGAMRSAALEMPGATKAQIGRLCYVPGERTDIYGTPKLLMSCVRMADAKRTPDVRSRCIIPRWATTLEVRFIEPNLTAQQVGDLLAAAGMVTGVGDWRTEKGSGSYGNFALVSEDNPEFQAILKEGRAAQVAAMDDPECYDDDTEELLGWFNAETKRRGFKVVG